jgi:hypothetical protein
MEAQFVEVKAKKRFSLSQHASSGAILATLIGVLWVLGYLVSASCCGPYGSQVLSYVTGKSINLGAFGSEALFVVITRFMIAFGLSWLPITLSIAIVRKFV